MSQDNEKTTTTEDQKTPSAANDAVAIIDPADLAKSQQGYVDQIRKDMAKAREDKIWEDFQDRYKDIRLTCIRFWHSCDVKKDKNGREFRVWGDAQLRILEELKDDLVMFNVVRLDEAEDPYSELDIRFREPHIPSNVSKKSYQDLHNRLIPHLVACANELTADNIYLAYTNSKDTRTVVRSVILPTTVAFMETLQVTHILCPTVIWEAEAS